ncbi:hypothetical protein [Aeromonas salmonicida]|uniref:hypothetical protein n=1 Tax=Aeromonas salmonicida TaxID=645 RepID=UPI003D3158C3
MSNSKAIKAHFKNFTLFVNAKEKGVDLNGKRVRTYSINSVSVKNNANGDTETLKDKLTDAKIGKLLTSAGYPLRKDGVVSSFGKAMRESIKSVTKANRAANQYTINGEANTLKDNDSSYAFVDTTGGVVKIWIIDVHYNNGTHTYGADTLNGTITCIICKESETGRSTCDVYQELICDNNGREGRHSPFIKGNTMTHHIEHMNKIENRGGARKVAKPITETSTLEENNVATVEMKEVVNQHADVINAQADEIARLKAMVEQLMADKGVNTPVISGRLSAIPCANGRYDRNDFINQEIDSLVGNL